MHLLYNILLTKIFNLMKKTELRAKVLLFSVVFFFMGMASINAQYVSNDEAVLILKAEIQELVTQAETATPEEQVDLAFHFHYYRHVAYAISDGVEVEVAIADNKPQDKAELQPSGFVIHVTNGTVKQEIDELEAHVIDLLSD